MSDTVHRKLSTHTYKYDEQKKKQRTKITSWKIENEDEKFVV